MPLSGGKGEDLGFGSPIAAGMRVCFPIVSEIGCGAGRISFLLTFREQTCAKTTGNTLDNLL